MVSTIHDIGEHALIRRSIQKKTSDNFQVRTGIGDDGAVVSPKKGSCSIVTTDMLIEGRHFRWSWLSARDLGRKAMEVNLSDLAAMGAMPQFVTVALGLPPQTTEREVKDFYRGARLALKPYGAEIIGGDTNGTTSAQGWIIAVTMIGYVSRRSHIPLRSEAKVGDVICVTGHLGHSALGLHLLKQNKNWQDGKPFIQKHLKPQARVFLGQSLAPHVHAMMDVSDGLLADLDHILRQSRCGARLEQESLLLTPQYQRVAQKVALDPVALALSGGEDYELLFTAPQEKFKKINEIAKKHRIPITLIGHVVASKGLKVLDSQDRLIRVQYKGFQHF
jgi:thiamine-monophosphate kinase